MSRRQKNIKMNQKLLNANMEQKFKIAFRSVIIGFIIVTLLAMGNILMYARVAGISVFSSFSRTVGLLLLFGAILLNFSLINVISKSLSASLVIPLEELQDAVKNIKLGNFDAEIQYESQDELGTLANELQEACIHMHKIVSDTGYILNEMAEGHFNVRSNAEELYVGDFQQLIVATNRLTHQLNDTMNQFKTSAEALMIGSGQLASGAQDLADGASDQAGAVEELTATISTVTNISNESAQNAVTAATNAIAAAQDAKKSREEINQLTDAMERITTTSHEIENIIAAIEDIAEQTNLLSLNASIEAARAGEAGRGFAVVADQIGKLATDSAKSAVTTRELISKCLLEVQSGNSIVENTLDSFGTVLVNMESFAEMASNSAETSKTQSDMLKQVESGIGQIASVVQNNSAAAQETSAMSEELSSQANKLEEILARFVL